MDSEALGASMVDAINDEPEFLLVQMKDQLEELKSSMPQREGKTKIALSESRRADWSKSSRPSERKVVATQSMNVRSDIDMTTRSSGEMSTSRQSSSWFSSTWPGPCTLAKDRVPPLRNQDMRR